MSCLQTGQTIGQFGEIGFYIKSAKQLLVIKTILGFKGMGQTSLLNTVLYAAYTTMTWVISITLSTVLIFFALNT